MFLTIWGHFGPNLAYEKILGKFTKVLGFGKTPPHVGKISQIMSFFFESVPDVMLQKTSLVSHDQPCPFLHELCAHLNFKTSKYESSPDSHKKSPHTSYQCQRLIPSMTKIGSLYCLQSRGLPKKITSFFYPIKV